MSYRNMGGWAVVNKNTNETVTIDSSRADAYVSKHLYESAFGGKFIVRKL